MIIDFADRILAKLPPEIKLHSLKLEETETSYSEWFAADN
jgi:6-pyruvoyltetrahydropterin/6-carboxytetrahydropterin synthase